MNDSGGDWNFTQAMIEEFGPQGFDLFAGSENFVLADLRAGGPGCITATANECGGAGVAQRRTPPISHKDSSRHLSRPAHP